MTSTAIDPSWYTSLLHNPLFALTLSLAAFKLGSLLYHRCKEFPLFHPTVSGAVLLAITLPLIGLDYQFYFDGNQLLTLLLGPATVALAVPMYQQLHLIRSLLLPIAVTVVVGGSFAVMAALAIAYPLGASTETLLSLAPKSITTPIAIGVSREIGGLESLATGAVVFTGVIGISLAPLVFRWLKVDDPRIWGFCLGLNAHGVGTARAFELNATAGAFSSLALCLTGTFSAIVIPAAANLIR